LFFDPLELLPHRSTLRFVELGGFRSRQTAMGAVHDRAHHLQVADQVGASSRRGLLLPLAFEKQRRIVQNAFSDRSRSPPPGAVELRRLAVFAAMLSEDCRHALAVLQTRSRHRHQKLHRRLRRDFAFPHLLLNRLRQKFH